MWSEQQAAYLHNAVADGAILPLPQQHQTDHNYSCYGHRDHQHNDQCTAPEAEVLSQGMVGPLADRFRYRVRGRVTQQQ